MKKQKEFKKLVSQEIMENFLRLTASQKLEWLDEAREFFFAAVPDRTKRIAEKMRQKGW